MILFIYGTLKRGQSAHYQLAGQEFLGEALTEPHYRLVDLGPHPTLVESDDGLACHGELWRVDAECLAKLEAYEDAPTYYHRQPVAIADFSGDVQAYFRVEPVSGEYPSGDKWP